MLRSCVVLTKMLIFECHFSCMSKTHLLFERRINFINFNFSLSSSNHTYSTRSAANNNLYVLRANKSYRQHFFTLEFIRLWNNLAPELRNVSSRGLFKFKLKQDFFM